MYDTPPEPSDDENGMLDLAFGLSDTSCLECQTWTFAFRGLLETCLWTGRSQHTIDPVLHDVSETDPNVDHGWVYNARATLGSEMLRTGQHKFLLQFSSSYTAPLPSLLGHAGSVPRSGTLLAGSSYQTLPLYLRIDHLASDSSRRHTTARHSITMRTTLDQHTMSSGYE
ncbi:hypothetical protein EDC04DRAFT_2609838 [Pisolithus marmoratus]|nr:hypothetical protein EDC04DRAFT_2609838 [Pisolithus marmoratus]